MALADLKLKAREDRRLRAGHLWVYSNEIDNRATPLSAFTPGDIVRVVSDRGRFLGYAGVSPNSLICARLMSYPDEGPPDAALLAARLATARALRDALYPDGTYRLLFGEADGLPGLVADRYGDIVVLQAGTATMEAMKGQVVDAVRDALEPAGILWRNDGSGRQLEGLPAYTEVAWGEVPELVPFSEQGVAFEVPVQAGQKTGWFLDQRDNRVRLARYPARRILDAFCYTGAWGLTAAARGASAVFVDASAQALDWVEAGARRAGVAVETHRGQAVEVLTALEAAGERFDVVVLDPPAFIKRRRDHAKGVAAYQRLNEIGARLVSPGGFLVSCSCSFHYTERELVSAVQRAARRTGRRAQLLETGGQSADHPVHPAMPETRYLKAVFCRLLGA